MKVGDHIRRKIGYVELEAHMATLVPMECECVVEYIHPEHRYYTLRVLLPSGRSFRTSEYFPQRAGY